MRGYRLTPGYHARRARRLATIAACAALVACAAAPAPDRAPADALAPMDPDHAVQVLLAATSADARYADLVPEAVYQAARVGRLCHEAYKPAGLRLLRSRVDAYFLTLQGVRDSGIELTDRIDLEAIRDPGAGSRGDGAGHACFGFKDAQHHRAYVIIVPSVDLARQAVAALQAVSSAAPARAAQEEAGFARVAADYRAAQDKIYVWQTRVH